MYRLGGAGSRLRKYTVGPYGRVTLPMARAQAQKIFAARLDGRDPAEERKQARRRLVVDQVEDLIETFIRERLSKVRTARTLSNRLRRDVIPYWGAKSVHDIKKRDVLIWSARSRSGIAMPAIGCSRRSRRSSAGALAGRSSRPHPQKASPRTIGRSAEIVF
jgi:hypothetical protein